MRIIKELFEVFKVLFKGFIDAVILPTLIIKTFKRVNFLNTFVRCQNLFIAFIMSTSH